VIAGQVTVTSLLLGGLAQADVATGAAGRA